MPLLVSFTLFEEGGGPQSSIKAKWVVLGKCSLRVDGSTNVNTFSCAVPEYRTADTLIFYNNTANAALVPMSGKLAIDVGQFDCSNDMMTKDLRKILKWKEYPNMYIEFLSLNNFPSFKTGSEQIVSSVNINIAGVSKRYNVLFRFSRNAQGIITLTGNQAINFSDFNISPPHKLGGMIKAKDRLDVEVRLSLRQVEPVGEK